MKKIFIGFLSIFLIFCTIGCSSIPEFTENNNAPMTTVITIKNNPYFEVAKFAYFKGYKYFLIYDNISNANNISSIYLFNNLSDLDNITDLKSVGYIIPKKYYKTLDFYSQEVAKAEKNYNNKQTLKKGLKIGVDLGIIMLGGGDEY